MNSPIIMPNAYQLRSTLAYTVLPPTSEDSIPFGPTHRSPSSWRKVIHKLTQQPCSEFVVTFIVVPTEKTVTEGPIVLKPKPLPEDYDARIASFLHFLDSLGSETEAIDDVMADQ